MTYAQCIAFTISAAALVCAGITLARAARTLRTAEKALDELEERHKALEALREVHLRDLEKARMVTKTPDKDKYLVN